jgi:hypothetical protein
MNYNVRQDLQVKFERRAVPLHQGTISEERLIKDYLSQIEKKGGRGTEQWAKEQIAQAVKDGLFAPIAEAPKPQPTIINDTPTPKPNNNIKEE